MEGGMEALLTKVSAEYILSDETVDALGALRQGFQSLRSAIQRQETLNWWGAEMPDYAAFKSLTTYVRFPGKCAELAGELRPDHRC
jgi:hypothetical protein